MFYGSGKDGVGGRDFVGRLGLEEGLHMDVGVRVGSFVVHY